MINSLYSVLKQNGVSDGKYSIEVQINPLHDIFKGHFPERPILPGVCMLEMIRLLLSDIYGSEYRLLCGENIKYAAVVDPTIDPVLTVDLAVTKTEENAISVKASISKAEKVFMKFKGTFA